MKRLVVLALFACSAPPKSAPPPRPPVPSPSMAGSQASVVVLPSPPAPLEYLDGTLAALAREYVDPNRFDFRKMLDGALDAMEEDVAEVIAETANDRVQVRVNDKEQEFAGDVDSLAELGVRLTEIIHFIQANAIDAKEIELTAVNGLLGTLDPHTNLISADDMREWAVQLTGTFGGIGVILGMVPLNGVDVLAITRVNPDTPAARSGLQSGDRILAINGQSTENFTIDEAINRMRGAPGTQVTLSIGRSSQKLEPTLTREEISVPSVESKMLDEQVGYLAISSFANATAKDFEQQMIALRDKGARAWVVDLRDNSGGLLAAAVRCADTLVDSGTIVATMQGGAKRDVKAATPGGVDTHAPLVVLVNSNTASSGEILAGALKQLDRGVLVGRTTFGKGSVQIMRDAAHGGKLKITIAEYVAANDISLQARGIAPDIELVPATIPKHLTSDADVVQLVPSPALHEVDLGSHLDTAQHLDQDKPVAIVPYVVGDKDFEIEFARQLVLATKSPTRKGAIAAVPKFLAKHPTEKAFVDAFKVLDIDWRAGKSTPQLTANFPVPKISTGSVVKLEGDITNDGKRPAFRIHARAVSEDPTFDGIELAFGAIAPKTTKHAIAYIRLPNGSASRAATIRWQITSDAKPVPLALTWTLITVSGKPYPSFALGADLADVPRRGERVTVKVHVTNRGAKSTKAIATLKSPNDERILVDRGRVEIGPMETNESKDVELAFSTRPSIKAEHVTLDVAISDGVLGATVTQPIEITFGTRAGHWDLSPPRLRIDDVPLDTTADHLRITGAADDEQKIDDFYITTTVKKIDRKVFYVSNRSAPTKGHLEFAVDVPLAPGLNRVTLVARETPSARGVRTLWITRR